MELTEMTHTILAYGDTCDHCLGRFLGKRSFGLTNAERGSALRITMALASNEPYKPAAGTCWICGNLFDAIGTWADQVIAAFDEIEYHSFLIGTRVPPLMAESEEMVWSDLHLTDAEPLKAELNREVGKAVSLRTGKNADLKNPDVVAILDPGTGTVEVEVHPVFFYGRYRKMERGIPQTHWDCRLCRGAGCERCGFTGKQYADSVEELIGREAAAAFLARGAVLHGSGREDIDARMMGTGRPFIMEMVVPQVRTVDLGLLEERINQAAAGRISVTIERWSGRHEVEIIKSNKAHKKYRILVEVDGSFSADEVRSALESLQGVIIYQRTPKRVAHRRADKIRERRALQVEYLGEESGKIAIEITGEAGLYIKELISGDDGRTTPSLAGNLGMPARVTSLDVVQVGEPMENE